MPKKVTLYKGKVRAGAEVQRGKNRHCYTVKSGKYLVLKKCPKRRTKRGRKQLRKKRRRKKRCPKK